MSRIKAALLAVQMQPHLIVSNDSATTTMRAPMGTTSPFSRVDKVDLSAAKTELGIPGPELKLVQRADSSGEEKGLSLSILEATAHAIVGEGLATEEEVRSAIASLTEFTSRGLDSPASGR